MSAQKEECPTCRGAGWYALFQLRYDCEACGTTGWVAVEEHAPEAVDDEEDDTNPMFFMPVIGDDDVI